MGLSTNVERNNAVDACVQPKATSTKGTRLTLTTSSAATSNPVPAGIYEVALDKSAGLCWVAWGTSVTLPTSGADPAAGTFVVRDGDLIVSDGTSKLAGILTGSGTTGELALNLLQ